MKKLLVALFLLGNSINALAYDLVTTQVTSHGRGTGLFLDMRTEPKDVFVFETDSPDTLADYVRELNRQYGMRDEALELRLNDDIYVVHGIEDIPQHSVKANCPPTTEGRCWFIKYRSE